MGVITVNQEFCVSVPPKRIFKALFLENQHVLPKVAPEHVKSVDVIEGDGGVGTIKQTNFTEGSRFNCWKTRIDALDIETCSIKITVIESDAFGDKLESVVFEVKVEASGEGAVVKLTGHYHAKADVEPSKEKIEAGKEKFLGFHKKVEEYLIANPHVCA